MPNYCYAVLANRLFNTQQNMILAITYVAILILNILCAIFGNKTPNRLFNGFVAILMIIVAIVKFGSQAVC